ncbi:MAG: UDP-N-acetylmuramoyl-tripeptide--D-alanyl-D-alanine ligase [Tatlockia sp.]
MNLKTIAALFNCSSPDETAVCGFCIDSRQVKPGYLFIALAGERFDGHDFIDEAQKRGAVGVLCSKNVPVAIPQIKVNDTLLALGDLARFYREGIHCPVIALTGSNGKTSVKEMIASILPKPSFATMGNLNNHIGAPLSVLSVLPQHRFAVFELGASHLNEIAYTVALVKPEVALINNIAPAHIEGFGSLDGVARAKGEIYQGLPSGGTAIVNADDEYAHFWDEVLNDKKVLRFALEQKPSADLYTENRVFDQEGCAQFDLIFPTGRAKITLQVPGEHSIRNALAAAACCYASGISLAEIVAGLGNFQGVAGRMAFRTGKNQSVIIDDSYNANLCSVLTAIEVLGKRPGRKILVLGDLGELGSYTRAHHESIGRTALAKGIDLLLTCGTHSAFSSEAFGQSAKHYQNQEELARDLLTKLDKETTVLVKGSRSAAMEKIVHQLLG